MTPTRVIVTRPAAQAASWVAELRARGVDAVALPLIDIEDAADPAPLAAAWAALEQATLAVFVSPNAVERFFAARPAQTAWPAATLAGATGPGTAAALAAAGVPPDGIVAPPADAPRFDSEALWSLLQARDWSGRRVLVVRGDGGRDWLASRLRERRADVRFVAAYRRQAPALDAAGAVIVDEALAAPRSTLWAFGSSEAVRHLGALRPDADWSASRAVAGHPRIADAARAAGFGSVALVGPTVDALAAAAQRPPIQSAPL